MCQAGPSFLTETPTPARGSGWGSWKGARLTSEGAAADAQVVVGELYAVQAALRAAGVKI